MLKGLGLNHDPSISFLVFGEPCYCVLHQNDLIRWHVIEKMRGLNHAWMGLNSPQTVIFVDFRAQSKYYLYTFIPRQFLEGGV